MGRRTFGIGKDAAVGAGKVLSSIMRIRSDSMLLSHSSHDDYKQALTNSKRIEG